MNNTRDGSVDIMMTAGIIFVVMGHSFQPSSFFFPAYSFHMPLFFFISGYLFSVKTDIVEKIGFARKKVVTQVIPYFVFEALFVFLTLVLQRRGLFSNVEFSPHSLFLEPFYTGHQIPLMIPLWFLLQLFVLNIVFQVSYWNKSKLYAWGMTVPIVFLGIYMARRGLALPKGLELLIVRTCICAIYFQLGIIFSLHKDFFSKITTAPVFIFAVWMLVATIPPFFGNTYFSIVFGSLDNPNVLVPVFSSSLLVIIVYGLCQLFSRAVDSSGLFFRLGRDSFWIMSLHMLGFFGINCVLYKLGKIDLDSLDHVYFQYDETRYFVFYLGAGLVFPLVAAEAFRRIKGKVQIIVTGKYRTQKGSFE